MEVEDIVRNLPELSTPRLSLRKLRAEDAEDVYEYARDPEMTREVIWPPHSGINDSRSFLKSVLERYSRGDGLDWGIELKANRKLIGTCGFVLWKPTHFKAEIGYAMSRAYWGRGLMSEAVAAVIEFGFKMLRLHRIEANCNITNPASERVMLKNGMKLEGILRDAMYVKGEFKTLKLYSILAAERGK